MKPLHLAEPVDVLVVGASIAGTSLAVGLHNKGLNVLLVERDAEVKHRFRGEYLQPFAVRTLTDLGFGQTVASPDVVRIRELRFRDLGRDSRDVLSETLVKYPEGEAATVIPNRSLVDGLRTTARRILGEKFLEGAKLDPVNLNEPGFLNTPIFKVVLSDKTVRTIAPRSVVGCDGRHSMVRKWMGGDAAPANGRPTFGASPEFIVGTELKAGRTNPERYEVVRTHGSGTMAIFHLSENAQRVYWNPKAVPKSNKKDWEQRLAPLFAEHRERMELGTEEFGEVAGCPADSVWLGPSSRGRFFLAGDALAVSTPLGGQGMSCASHHVLKLLELVERDVRDFDIARAEYEQCTRRWYRQVSLLNFGLYYLFYAHSPVFKHSTRHILNTWEQSVAMRDRVGRLFGGLDEDTPGIPELLKLWGIRRA